MIIYSYCANTSATWLARQHHTVWRHSATAVWPLPTGADEPDVGREYADDNAAN